MEKIGAAWEEKYNKGDGGLTRPCLETVQGGGGSFGEEPGGRRQGEGFSLSTAFRKSCPEARRGRDNRKVQIFLSAKTNGANLPAAKEGLPEAGK